MTRARAQASALTEKLEMEGAKVMEVPAIKITDPDDFAPLDTAQKNLAAYDWVIFTSANGVDLFFDRLLQNGKDARAFAHNKIAAIGTATADMLTAYGLTADLIPASYKAEDLVDTSATVAQRQQGTAGPGQRSPQRTAGLLTGSRRRRGCGCGVPDRQRLRKQGRAAGRIKE